MGGRSVRSSDNVADTMTDALVDAAVDAAAPIAVSLISRFGKKLIAYWLARSDIDLPGTSAHTDPSDQVPPFLVVGLGRCGCHVSAELSQIISSHRPTVSKQSPKPKAVLDMFWSPRGPESPPLLFKPIMLVGDIDETSFNDIDGLLDKGGVEAEVKTNYLRLNYQPIAEGGVGHVPIFAEFISKALLLIPDGPDPQNRSWQNARNFLTSFSASAEAMPRLVFYIFSSGGGTGAGSASEIMRAQNYARIQARSRREYYFSGITILPRRITRDQRQIINTGRTIIQYLSSLNIELESRESYDESPSCAGGAFLEVDDERSGTEGQKNSIMPWNALAFISNDIMSSSANDPMDIEEVESNTNQYIAQQVFNLAAAQFPAAYFDQDVENTGGQIERKNYQATRLDPNDLKTGLLGPYAIAFSARSSLSEGVIAEIDKMFISAIGLPSSKIEGHIPDIIEGISVTPTTNRKYQTILADLRARMAEEKCLMSEDLERMRDIPFFYRCPRLIYSLTVPQDSEFPAAARERLEELIDWCFPSLIQKRAAITRGTTAVYSLSIFVETSVLLSPDLQNAVVNYLRLCWSQRRSDEKQFLSEYKDILEQDPPIDDEYVKGWLGEVELYGRNVPNFDSLCTEYNTAWQRYVASCADAENWDEGRTKMLLEHCVEDVFLNYREVTAALRYLNYARNVQKSTTIEIDEEFF